MKKYSLLLLFIGLWILLPAQEDSFVLEKNIQYQREAKVSVDEYVARRCVLDIYYPENGKGFATIVWFHGGGLENGDKYIPDNLLNKGVAVVSVNYRLHPVVKCPVYIEDAASAVSWTFNNIEKYDGDPSLIFVAGHSAGGYLASMLGLDKRWLMAHNIDANQLAGIIPFSGQSITHSTIRRERGITVLQPVVDDYAPLFHVRDDAPPLLLLTGDKRLEMKARYEENVLLEAMMRAVGHKYTKLYEIQGYGHSMVEPGVPVMLNEIQKIVKNGSEK
jgi:acetyl esterase/lipase